MSVTFKEKMKAQVPKYFDKYARGDWWCPVYYLIN